MIKQTLFVFIAFLTFSCTTSENEQINNTASDERIIGERHFLSGYEPITEDSLVNVVIEIPAGTDAKWEVELDSGDLAWEYRDGKPRIVNYVGYPGNYGMVPQTKLGKGDAIDILVLGAPLERGSIVQTKLIGVLEMIDGGEPDSKLIAVPLDSHFNRVNNIGELDENFPGVSTIISLWFDHYKGPVNDVEILGVSETDRAWEILQGAMEDY
jgi:inorganic pyrophosphatase